MKKAKNSPLQFSSSPCFAHELEFSEEGYTVCDPVQRSDVARWRTAERLRLYAARMAIPVDHRKIAATEVTKKLNKIIKLDSETVVSVYWPIKGEPDLREWMHYLYENGVRVALPVVETRNRPLVFRAWTPSSRLVPGIWNIPVPAEGGQVTPTVVVAPLVGFDMECFRLGNGGGYFDRTLSALTPRPSAVGVGHASLQIPTIFPQAHDVPMDIIVGNNDLLIERQ